MSQVPTDAFGRPKFLPSGKKNPNFGKDDPGGGSDYELGKSLLDTKPKESHPTKRTKQREPYVQLGGETFAPVSKTIEWLNRNVTGDQPPPAMRGFTQYLGDAQGYTWEGNKSLGQANGQIAFYPDNWQHVGIFVQYKPSDFGAKGKPYWIRLDPPEGAGPGRKTAWQRGQSSGVYRDDRVQEVWPSQQDRYGRSAKSPYFGADQTPPTSPVPQTMKPFH